MSAADVRRKIEAEIGDDWSRSNLHGVDLSRCLLQEPVLTTYKDSLYDPAKPEDGRNKSTIQLWLVLEEDPIQKKGYKIVYDERLKKFGLATGDTFIGFYGTFIQTLDGM